MQNPNDMMKIIHDQKKLIDGLERQISLQNNKLERQDEYIKSLEDYNDHLKASLGRLEDILQKGLDAYAGEGSSDGEPDGSEGPGQSL